MSDALDVLRGIRSIPRGFTKTRAADVRRRLVDDANARLAVHSKAATHLSRLRAEPGSTIPARRDLDRLRAITDRLARRRLIAPTPAPPPSTGIQGISYTATIAPPYDYAFDFAFPTHNPPRATSSSNAATGAITCNVATSANKESESFGRAEVGLYFRPTSPSLLRISTTPSFAFAWWANSIAADSPAVTRASGSLAVSIPRGGFAGPIDFIVQDAVAWDINIAEELRFDFGSSAGTPLTIELEVTPASFYILNVSCECRVKGAGWPGSLAGAQLSMTVPSMTLHVEPILVAESMARTARKRSR